MADISKITPPGSQTTYNLKDATAREQAAENKNNISLIKQVPTVSSGDNGKVLTAGSSSYSWTTPTITGVKGGQESTYRTGNVSISAANILSTAQQNAVNSGVTSSTVSQVATNTSNIAWTKKTLQFSATAADTYEYTGLSIACPANTLLEIWAIDDNSNSRVTAIAVTDSNTSIDAIGSVIGENAEPLSMAAGAQWAQEVHCVTPRLYSSVHTYYVWVKRDTTGVNNVTLLTRKIVTQ